MSRSFYNISNLVEIGAGMHASPNSVITESLLLNSALWYKDSDE